MRIAKIKYNFVKHAIRIIKLAFGLFEAVNACLHRSRLWLFFERPVMWPYSWNEITLNLLKNGDPSQLDPI